MRWFPGGSLRWRRCQGRVWAAAAGLKLAQTSHEMERSIEQKMESLQLIDEEKREMVLSEATQMIEEVRMYEKMPGLAVAISVDGKMVYKKAFGYKDIENCVPATVDWKLHVASVSKLVAAHCWMKFMQENVDQYIKNWSLHDLISDFYKKIFVIDLKENEIRFFERDQIRYYVWDVAQNDPVPMEALLYHKTGMFHYFSQRSQYSYQQFSSQTAAYQEKLRMSFLQFFDSFPGTQSVYTSEGINMIGVGLERLHPLSYKEFATNELKSLGMNESCFRELDETVFASSYGYASGIQTIEPDELSLLGELELQMNEIITDFSNVHPSEGLVATVGDLNKFGNIYANLFDKSVPNDSSPDVLDGDTVRKIWSPYHCYHTDMLLTFSRGLCWELRQQTERICPGTDKGVQWKTKAWHEGYGLGSQSCLLVELFRCKKQVIKEGIVDDAWGTCNVDHTVSQVHDAYDLQPHLLDVFKINTQKDFIDNYLWKPDYVPLYQLRLEYIRLMGKVQKAWDLRNDLALSADDSNVSYLDQVLKEREVEQELLKLRIELSEVAEVGKEVMDGLKNLWTSYGKKWGDKISQGQERIKKWRRQQQRSYDELRNRDIVEEEIKLRRHVMIKEYIEDFIANQAEFSPAFAEFYQFVDAINRDLTYMSGDLGSSGEGNSFAPQFNPGPFRLCDDAFDPPLFERNYFRYEDILRNLRGGGGVFTCSMVEEKKEQEDDDDLEQSSDLDVSREGFNRRCVVVALISNQREAGLAKLASNLSNFFGENYV